MKFGVLMELQYPRPWSTEGEQALFQSTVEQIELADELGFDHAWEVEHHFLEEYSHSSAPEIVLAAASRNTKRIRLGHGIVAMPPTMNPTARVAERIATLDLISGGRVDFGTGETASRMELEGYNVPLEEKRAAWLEATEQVANMLALDPYPGFDGKHVKMPARNVVPKPVQKPHPPMWMACSNRESIHLAARLGLGALAFALVNPETAKGWIDEYYDILKRECVPIGHTVNANVAMCTQLFLDEDGDRAWERGFSGRLFFSVATSHYYVDGVHRPGRADLWSHYQEVKPALEAKLPRIRPSAMASPEECRDLMRGYQAIGTDQVLFIAQMGDFVHDEISRSLRLCGEQVMPEFQRGEEDRVRIKEEQLGPYIEAALARKQWMQPLGDDVPEFKAFERKVAAAPGESKPGEFEPDSWQVMNKRLMERAGLGERKQQEQ